eukprot:6736045-Karenia_brevis.AAC.1
MKTEVTTAKEVTHMMGSTSMLTNTIRRWCHPEFPDIWMEWCRESAIKISTNHNRELVKPTLDSSNCIRDL